MIEIHGVGSKRLQAIVELEVGRDDEDWAQGDNGDRGISQTKPSEEWIGDCLVAKHVIFLEQLYRIREAGEIVGPQLIRQRPRQVADFRQDVRRCNDGAEVFQKSRKQIEIFKREHADAFEVADQGTLKEANKPQEHQV